MNMRIYQSLTRWALLGGVAILAGCGGGADPFAEADKDGDGKLSKPELGRVLLNAVYSAGDANGDSRITWEEWKTVDPQAKKSDFDLRDGDRDGAVTPAELKAYSDSKKSFDKLFASIDKSGDGFVDRTEAKDFHSAMMAAEGETEMEKLINYSRQ
jgi:Ca2+-binding EF-hand superfamily protein